MIYNHIRIIFNFNCEVEIELLQSHNGINMVHPCLQMDLQIQVAYHDSRLEDVFPSRENQLSPYKLPHQSQ